MKSIGDEDKQRVDERKKKLGKKGLKELKLKVENAVYENDVCYTNFNRLKSLIIWINAF